MSKMLILDCKTGESRYAEEIFDGVEAERADLEREQLAPPETKRVEISREDFDLLDVTDSSTIYYIIEEDGSVTVRKGED